MGVEEEVRRDTDIKDKERIGSLFVFGFICKEGFCSSMICTSGGPKLDDKSARA